MKGQFPVTINADGTTPWDYLTSGPRHAAELCRKWNLQLWSSKYALDEIHEVVMETKDKVMCLYIYMCFIYDLRMCVRICTALVTYVHICM